MLEHLCRRREPPLTIIWRVPTHPGWWSEAFRKKFPKKYVHFNKVCVIFKLSIMITLKVLKSVTLKQCWNVGPFPEACPNNGVFWVLYKTVPESEKCDFYLGVNYVSENFLFIAPWSRSSSPLPTGAGADAPVAECAATQECQKCATKKCYQMLPHHNLPWVSSVLQKKCYMLPHNNLP